MSSGREFQRTDAATGNERHPTVDRRNDGTRSEWVDDDRSRRRPYTAIRVQRLVSDEGLTDQSTHSRLFWRRVFTANRQQNGLLIITALLSGPEVFFKTCGRDEIR